MPDLFLQAFDEEITNMPIYEYRCDDCDHQFEALQKMSDDALTDCPKCNQPALKKLLTAGGFRLSGSGWYETDFKSGNKKNISGDQKSADSETASAE
jgi:putative FmdB family regulatory protein